MTKGQYGLLRNWVFDEDSGEWIDFLSGEVMSASEYDETFPAKDPLQGEYAPKLTLDELFDKVCSELNDLQFCFGEPHRWSRTASPDLIVGETDLVKGAGTETKVIPPRIVTDIVEPDKALASVLEAFRYFLVKVKEKKATGTPLNKKLYKLAWRIFAFADGIEPLVAARSEIGPWFRQTLRDKKALQEALIDAYIYNWMTRREMMRACQKTHRLENVKASLLGELRKLRQDIKQSIVEIGEQRAGGYFVRFKKS